MRTREEYIFMHKYLSDFLNQKNTSYLIKQHEKFVENFDMKTLQTVDNINKNYHLFQKSDWQKIYNENKENIAVLMSMLKTQNCPIEVVEQIVMNMKTVKDNIKESYRQSYEEQQLFALTLQYDLPLSCKEIMCDHMKHQIATILSATQDTILSATQEYAKKTIEKINESNIEYYCKHIVQNYRPTLKIDYTSNEQKPFTPLLWIRNKDFIKELADYTENQHAKTALINNLYLNPSNTEDEKIMNYIYDTGCLPENIEKFTPYIAQNCSQYFWDGYTWYKESEENKRNNHQSYYNCRRALINLISKNLLTEAYEYDLGMRVLDEKNRYSDELVRAIFCHTKNELLMEKIQQIKSKDKQEAFKNPNLPARILQAETSKICDKMKKLISKNQEQKISDVWYDYLKEHCLRVPLRHDDYEFLITNRKCPKTLCMNIVSSPATPIDEIKNIINLLQKKIEKNETPSYYYAEQALFAAKINLFSQTNTLDSKTKNWLYQYIRYLPYSVDITKLIGERQDSNTVYATQNLKFIVNNSPKEDIDKINGFFNEYNAQSNLSKQEKRFTESTVILFGEYIEKNNKEKEDKRIDETTTNIKEYTERKINNTLKQIAEDTIRTREADTYPALNANVELFYELYHEIQRRSISKETIEEER